MGLTVSIYSSFVSIFSSMTSNLHKRTQTLLVNLAPLESRPCLFIVWENLPFFCSFLHSWILPGGWSLVKKLIFFVNGNISPGSYLMVGPCSGKAMSRITVGNCPWSNLNCPWSNLRVQDLHLLHLAFLPFVIFVQWASIPNLVLANCVNFWMTWKDTRLEAGCRFLRFHMQNDHHFKVHEKASKHVLLTVNDNLMLAHLKMIW